MLKSIAAVIAGIVAGVVVVFVVESIGHTVFPLPPGTDVTDPSQLATLMDRMPTGALIMVIVGWAGGALAAGYTAARISGGLRSSLVAGVALLGAGVSTMTQIPHPVWMIVAGVVLPIPLAFAAAKFALGRTSAVSA